MSKENIVFLVEIIILAIAPVIMVIGGALYLMKVGM